MEHTSTLISNFSSDAYDNLLADIYVDTSLISYQKQRYIEAIRSYIQCFGEGDVSIYSAPGRSEIGGNHTDHQHGQVLAAGINLDAIAVVCATSDSLIQIKSDGYDMITIDTGSPCEPVESEKESTISLIRGVVEGMRQHGHKLGGFQAYITSDVLIGAGLSSSAAFEVLIGTILSGLYNEMKVSPIEIAIISQYAENVYFGKPCGLMDQMACSVGSLVHIDFKDTTNPAVEKVEFDLERAGYSLCITDTKGSHADLTADYAAVPAEMKAVAELFGKSVLVELTEDMILENITKIRQALGDRAVLRALHFYEENRRVETEVSALKNADINLFLNTVKASGASSFQYLQNVYTNHDIASQNMSVALAVSDIRLGADGVCRVHGGGFAGTIQAFVKNTAVEQYRSAMDKVFGEHSCKVLKIRKFGGMKVL
ncbi:MAG: galactokinase [Acetatifactor sp.]|nr:galactokinase [Acetatifactor sp.]